MKFADAKLGVELVEQLESLRSLRETYKKTPKDRVKRLTVFCTNVCPDGASDGDGTMDDCTIIPVNVSHAVLDMIEDHIVADLKRLEIELPDKMPQHPRPPPSKND